ncbi:uncharacterized protein BT62DRAFT_1076472 [Guyanagaster necrorhizus]|uniref:Uncharacterized protein n=1 Tax=Guyanagaster necrorhizus TaxID=856835 RepID=A0A9P7VSH5_9AGAR|nr:uncharacterized protein BT62DRAFT_1076472 [Guyanagaster necrorhizus MCA 3950]KAG7446079.1 hypothetical protein BT62DRAFT_1076472 [Guyanagaster necrorhizus MCA 3950]
MEKEKMGHRPRDFPFSSYINPTRSIGYCVSHLDPGTHFSSTSALLFSLLPFVSTASVGSCPELIVVSWYSAGTTMDVDGAIIVWLRVKDTEHLEFAPSGSRDIAEDTKKIEGTIPLYSLRYSRSPDMKLNARQRRRLSKGCYSQKTVPSMLFFDVKLQVLTGVQCPDLERRRKYRGERRTWLKYPFLRELVQVERK